MKLKKSMRLALAQSACIMTSTLFVVGASAQGDPNQVGLEEIIVTGSHIRQKTGFEGVSPVSVLGREAIVSSGSQDLLDASSLLTVNSGSVQSQETGNLIGTSQFNVRGLGVGSTLTLINGRRAGLSTVADSSGIQFFDNKQLPLAMISRLDVQTDGASATYGSDAVGGVVNIITRKGFEGVELSARYQDASNESASLNLASGFRTEKGIYNLYATAYGQSRNHRTDFDWLVERIHGDGDLTQSRLTSALGSPGTYRHANVQGIPSIDFDSATITESGSRFADPDCLAANGVLKAGRCRFNFADQVAPIPEEKRIQIFTESEYEVNDTLNIFAELSYSKNKIERTQGANAYRNGLVEGGDIYIPADHPFNFFVDDPSDPGGNLVYIGPDNWDNSIHTAVDLVCECRPFGFEANGFNNNPPFNRNIDLEYTRGVIGFEKQLGDVWTFSGNYTYSLAEREFTADNFYNALTLNGSVLDGTFNPFGTSRTNPSLVSPRDGVSLAGNSDETIDFIQNDLRRFRRSRQEVMDLIFSGELFEIDGRAIGVAFGYQNRRNDLLIIADELSSAGFGNNPERPQGSFNKQNVDAVFAEAAIPLTETFDVQLALRYEDYGGSIGSTVDPKVAFRWQATDRFGLRGSYGTAFRAPSIPQFGTSSSSTFIDDPFTGDSSIAIVNVQGDVSLVPESSKNYNLGIIYQPIDGLDFKLDYWMFDYDDLITADEGAQAIIENDFNDDGIANDPRVIRTGTGQLRFINSTFINTGNVVTDGVDLAVNYQLPTSVGSFNMGAAVSVVNSFDVTNGNGSTFDGVGSRNFTNQFTSLPKLRGNVFLGWNNEAHSFNSTIRYIDSYENDQSDDLEIDSWLAVDFRYSYAFNLFDNDEPTHFSIGARNVFDEDPPSLGEGQRPAYDDRVHDIRGKQIFAEIKHTFN